MEQSRRGLIFVSFCMKSRLVLGFSFLFSLDGFAYLFLSFLFSSESICLFTYLLTYLFTYMQAYEDLKTRVILARKQTGRDIPTLRLLFLTLS